MSSFDLSNLCVDFGIFDLNGNFHAGSAFFKEFNLGSLNLLDDLTHEGAVRIVSSDPWALIFFRGKGGYLGIKVEKLNLLEGLMLNMDLSRLFTLGTLVSRVSHEFNNILTGISGQASFLYELTADPELKRSAELLKEGIEKSIILTRELVSFSKPNSRYERIKVSTFLERLRLWIKVLVPPRIIVEIVDNSGDVEFETDLSKLNQILVNLVKNSVEAIADRGKIKIEVGCRDGYLLVSVEDDGGGMSEENLKLVFKPFATTKESGTGLGCYICKKLVEQLGGQISASTVPGKSCRFEVQLPLNDQSALKLNLKEKQKEIQQSKIKVLLVDDDENVREVLRMGLDHAGFMVDSADCCDAALNLARSKSYDLAVVDIIMPGKSGLETAIELKQIQPGIKFIVISGYSPPETIDVFRAIGVKSFLNKPFAISELIVEINRVMGINE